MKCSVCSSTATYIPSQGTNYSAIGSGLGGAIGLSMVSYIDGYLNSMLFLAALFFLILFVNYVAAPIKDD